MSCTCCRYALMREMSDGTCRPCTTSEAAAMKGTEPPTRSPSVNPTRPLRAPMQPALSPLGRPNLAAMPALLEEPGASPARVQETERQPKEALKASALPAQRHLRGPDEATGPGQHNAQPCGHSDKENGTFQPTNPLQYVYYWCIACPALWHRSARRLGALDTSSRTVNVLLHAGSVHVGKGKRAAARSGAPAPGKAQQANSEDTVTASALETGEDTETDDESATARQVHAVAYAW